MAVLNRRALLAGSGGLCAWALRPRTASAAGSRDERLVVILLRGAIDGLAVVPPIGDQDYALLRGSLALRGAGAGAAMPLDGPFFLHPDLPTFHKLYADRQLAVVHAVATPYRSRSHFEGQDVLEGGGATPYALKSGWLNRMVAGLPAERVHPGSRMVGLAPTTPLILQGAAPSLTWAPPSAEAAGEDLYSAALALYQAADPLLAAALRSSGVADKIAATDGVGALARSDGALAAAVLVGRLQGQNAGRFIGKPEGPRVAALSLYAWDNHSDEAGVEGRLAKALRPLDACIAGLREQLGPIWQDTTVLAISEFGRTIRPNGAGGTDHGTGTVAFLMGGRVRGGRVLGDWPGLKPQALLEGRDLRPTTDLRALQKGLARELFDLPSRALDAEIFPDSAGVKPLDGLLA